MPVDPDGVITPPAPNFSSLHCPIREVPALSRPDQDPTIRKWRLLEGSPAPGDSRLYLDVRALEALLDHARQSPTQRVIVHAVEFEVDLREARNGHRYQVIKFEGVVAPEGLFTSDRQITRAGG